MRNLGLLVIKVKVFSAILSRFCMFCAYTGERLQDHRSSVFFLNVTGDSNELSRRADQKHLAFIT